jgi:alpha-ketoglutarate-dependent taurine dioxygenase
VQAGALLLRGFCVDSAEAFHGVVAAIRPRLKHYVGGDSPRTKVGDRIYTSTEFPAQMEIGLHNELSYTRVWPECLFFCCLVPAQSGGETHIADGRSVFAQLDPAVCQRFSQSGVIYRQHLRSSDEPGPGKSWPETFDCGEPAQVERICSAQGMEFSWTRRGLRTTLRNPAVLTHPITGEMCWFNQADLWHAGFDSVKAQEHGLTADEDPNELLGCHSSYGDGSEIPDADLQAVRAAYRKSEILFPWQTGDLLVLDNVLAMHGRKPFSGERSVLVAMA